MIDLQTENSTKSFMATAEQRLTALKKFVAGQLGHARFNITPLAGDASFRRYFRVSYDDKTLVAMDAPPDKEDCRPFVAVSKIFQNHDLQVPSIIGSDYEQGYLLLTDFGDDLYFRVLKVANANELYVQAIKELPLIQACQNNAGYVFPDFAPFIQEELLRFREWYLLRHLQLSLTVAEETLLEDTFALLIKSAREQPQVCVHRDYHSRNLLVLPENNVGILDFQDAVWGPVTYDLVSLIRDCYIAWPQKQVLQWANYYHELALDRKIIAEKSSAVFTRWLDLMGVQRHLKAIYIFARKFHRDNNDNYLADIPRALRYVLDVSENYPELQTFKNFLAKVAR